MSLLRRTTLDKKKNHNTIKKAGGSAALALAGGFLILPYEGEVKNAENMHVAYLDPVGIHTACYGQTDKDLYGRTIRAGMKYTDDECMEMFILSSSRFEEELDKLYAPLWQNDYQKAAMISFAYNVGIRNVKTSTLAKHFTNKNYEEACDQLSRWVYAKKKKLPGLVTRREEERQFCLATDSKVEQVEKTLEIEKDLVEVMKEKNKLSIFFALIKLLFTK